MAFEPRQELVHTGRTLGNFLQQGMTWFEAGCGAGCGIHPYTSLSNSGEAEAGE